MKKVTLLVLFAVVSFIQVADSPYAAEEMVDGIVAIVGDEIILFSDLQQQLNAQMMARNLNLKSDRNKLLALRDEVVQGMVDDLLLLEKARRDSIEVDREQVDIELKSRIMQFKEQVGTEEAYQEALDEYGMTELQFRNMHRSWIAKNMLKMSIARMMQRLISVTPQDIETWFEAHKDSLPDVPERFKTSHILFYPKVSDELTQEAKNKIQSILERIRNGEDFAELARQYSEDPGNAQDGGELPYFKREDFDPDFSAAAFALQENEVSDLVETIFGYHIIKVEDIRGDEIKARHILIRLSPVEDDQNIVIEQLKKIREDIVSGKATFTDMAKQYSEDEDSRELGGALQWLPTPTGDILPSFRNVAVKLKVGEISEPFKSQYGYHILQLDDHQPKHILNIKDDRNRVEELIIKRKTLDEYNKIIQELRSETFIDIRL